MHLWLCPSPGSEPSYLVVMCIVSCWAVFFFFFCLQNAKSPELRWKNCCVGTLCTWAISCRFLLSFVTLSWITFTFEKCPHFVFVGQQFLQFFPVAIVSALNFFSLIMIENEGRSHNKRWGSTCSLHIRQEFRIVRRLKGICCCWTFPISVENFS